MNKMPEETSGEIRKLEIRLREEECFEETLE